MALSTTVAKSEDEPSPAKHGPPGSTRFDWIVVALSASAVAGYFLVSWAFFHGKPNFTSPASWAAPVYASVAALLAVLLFAAWRNSRKGYGWRWALPQGYGSSLAGVGLTLLGAMLYPIWQRLLPAPEGLERGLALPNLGVATGLILGASGPIRAARARLNPRQARGWATLGPLVLSVTLVLSVLTNLTLFANPTFEPYYGPYGGKTVRIGQGHFSDLYLMNADGTGQTRLTSSARSYAWSSDWSPDGTRIVFTRGEPDTPESALFIMNVDGNGLRQLTDLPGEVWVPAWAPDGARIAFVSKTARGQQIYAINADGTDVRQLTHMQAPTYGPAWSPDGTRLVYTSNASGSDQLYTMDADGGNQRQITAQGIFNFGAAWSPDGNWIALNSYRGRNWDLYAIHPDGSGERRLTDSPAREVGPAWSPDGRQLAFVSEYAGAFDLYAMGADGGNARNLTQNHALEFVFPRWSPDGSRIMVTASGHPTRPNAFLLQDLGVAGVLIQSALLVGAVLALIAVWTVPAGALTGLFALNGLLMAAFGDRYALVIPVLLAGLLAELLRWWLNPSVARRQARSLFAVAVPVIYYGLYFLALQLTQGIAWSIHLWLGALVMAGLAGWFVGFLVAAAPPTARATASP
jgi:Tol biopolymer transport system component